MRKMKILKAGGEEFTGNSDGKSIRDIYLALDGADALVLMTAHRKFREIDLRRVKERMRTPIIIDGRRVFDKNHASGQRVQHFGWTILEQDGVRGLGFVYEGEAGNYSLSMFAQSRRSIKSRCNYQRKQTADERR